jgi:hypothetical protein
MAKLLSGTRIYGSATIDTTISLGTSAIFTGSTSGTTTLLASAAAGTTTLTLPAATDILVGRTTTDTLTNKTLSSSTLTGTLTAGGGVGTNGQVLSSTGSGVQWVDQTGGGGSGNSFTTIAVAGQSSVLADNTTDTLTLVASGVIGISTNATTDTITIGTAASFFPFTKYDGNASNIPLYTEMTTLQNSLDTVFLPFIKSDGSSVTTLKLTA